MQLFPPATNFSHITLVVMVTRFLIAMVTNCMTVTNQQSIFHLGFMISIPDIERLLLTALHVENWHQRATGPSVLQRDA